MMKRRLDVLGALVLASAMAGTASLEGCSAACPSSPDELVSYAFSHGADVEKCSGVMQTPPDDGGTGNDPLCTAAADDDACASCLKANCCEQMTLCVGATSCACLVGCVQSGQTYTPCQMANACGPDTGLLYTGVASCAVVSCASSCPALH